MGKKWQEIVIFVKFCENEKGGKIVDVGWFCGMKIWRWGLEWFFLWGVKVSVSGM